MRRLVFIDDDKSELEAFREIVSGAYDYTAVHWPGESAKLQAGPKPAIFVSDLYLPSHGDAQAPGSTQVRIRWWAQNWAQPAPKRI